MKLLLPYRIISFILLPVAAFFGIIVLIMLAVALSNPQAFLIIFLFLSVVIYSISSFIFLQKGIENQAPCKASLRDWIRVNAIVSIVFGVWFIVTSSALLSNTNLTKEFLQQMMAAQPGQVVLSEAGYLKILKGILYFFLIYSSVLLVHVVLTFRMLKEFGHRFLPK